VSQMSVYQHDGLDNFRFVLLGDLKGTCVSELDHAWTTATSVLEGKDLVMDISAVTGADSAGLELLRRMRESGVRMTSTAPPAAPDLARSLGVAVAPALRLHKETAARSLPRWLARLSGLGT